MICDYVKVKSLQVVEKVFLCLYPSFPRRRESSVKFWFPAYYMRGRHLDARSPITTFENKFSGHDNFSEMPVFFNRLAMPVPYSALMTGKHHMIKP